MSRRTIQKPGPVPAFRKTKIAAAIAAVSGLYAVPVAGEDAGAQLTVEEIIVTARKREQNIQDTPVSIQAFTSDDIDRLDISRFEDFADQSASISYISVGPGTQVMHIRGVSDGGIPHVFRTNAATTAYYLDEQPVTGRNGGAPDLHLYDIERIEVLRGPEGTYYGASAVSGTVRIISKQPDPEQFEYGVDLTGGSISDGDTTYTAEGFVNVPLSDRAALRGVFWYDKSKRLHRQPAFGIHLPQRRHRQQRPLRRRGLQRGRDPGRPRLAARRSHGQLDGDAVGVHAVPGRGRIVEPRPDAARRPRGHPPTARNGGRSTATRWDSRSPARRGSATSSTRRPTTTARTSP